MFFARWSRFVGRRATSSGGCRPRTTRPHPFKPGLECLEERALLSAYNNASQWSATDNPSGPWTYGYLAPSNPPGKPDASTFTPFTAQAQAATPYGLVYGWRTPGAGEPNVSYNPLDQLVSIGTVTLQPHQAAFHPGPNGEYGDYRFTAPTAGVFALSATFTGIDTHGGADKDVHVRLNGTALYDATLAGSYGSTTSYSNTVTLAAGDQVDFLVGYGSGPYYYDNTALDASLDPRLPPVVHDPQATTREGTPVVIPVLASATDPNGTTLSVAAVSSPTAAGGTAVLNADGTVTYTPAPHFVGSDSFTFTVQNAYGQTATAPVAVTVTAVADPPSLTVADARGNEGAPLPLNVSATIPDTSGGETLSLTVGGVPAGAVLSHGTDTGGGVWALTPADLAGLTLTAPDDATFTLHVTATSRQTSDGDTASTTADLQVIVAEVAPTATVTGPTDGVPGQPRTFTLSAADPSPADQAAGFTFHIAWGDGAIQTVTGPSGTQVDHTYTQYGEYSMTVTAVAQDGAVSASVAQTVTVKPWVIQQQPDPLHPGKTLRVLVIGVATGEDAVHVTPAGPNGGINLNVGWDDLGAALCDLLTQPIDRIVVYAPGDGDGVHVAHLLGIPVEFHDTAGEGGPNEHGTDGGQHDDGNHPTPVDTDDQEPDGSARPVSPSGGDQGRNWPTPVAGPSGGSGSTSPGSGHPSRSSATPGGTHHPGGRQLPHPHRGKGKAR